MWKRIYERKGIGTGLEKERERQIGGQIMLLIPCVLMQQYSKKGLQEQEEEDYWSLREKEMDCQSSIRIIQTCHRDHKGKKATKTKVTLGNVTAFTADASLHCQTWSSLREKRQTMAHTEEGAVQELQLLTQRSQKVSACMSACARERACGNELRAGL